MEMVVKRTLRLTQHKRFVPYGTHPNFCFAKTSFMLVPLAEMAYKEVRWNSGI
jgi:hypothetical protein